MFPVGKGENTTMSVIEVDDVIHCPFVAVIVFF